MLCLCVCVRVIAGEDRLEVVARDFRVTNSRQELLFAANRKEVVVGADILRVSGEIIFFPLSAVQFYIRYIREMLYQEPIAI